MHSSVGGTPGRDLTRRGNFTSFVGDSCLVSTFSGWGKCRMYVLMYACTVCSTHAKYVACAYVVRGRGESSVYIDPFKRGVRSGGREGGSFAQ